MIALPFALAALLLTPPLQPGRYAGAAATGRVDLTLFEDGRAIFGGAAMRWTAAGDGLVLKAAGGRATTLSVRHDADGALLDGGPYGPIRLTPLPGIEPVTDPAPIRPLDWIGAWLHRASGGALILRLRADGRYSMEQPVEPGRTAIPPVTGAWQALDARLVLTPDGGAPLSYTARRDGADLIVGGGDLPVEVRFSTTEPR